MTLPHITHRELTSRDVITQRAGWLPALIAQIELASGYRRDLPGNAGWIIIAIDDGMRGAIAVDRMQQP